MPNQWWNTNTAKRAGRFVVICALCIFMGEGARVCAATTTRFGQATIDAAVGSPLLAFVNTGAGLQNDPMQQAKAFYFMALLVHLDPAATTSDGTVARARLLEQIRHLIAGGNEPNANGSLSGWTHGSVANAFALAKSTPAIWAALQSNEIERIDWLMRAMAIAGHFGFDDGNDYRTGLGWEGNFHKLSNPNYREGYVGVVLAAAHYFGAGELNAIFATFDFDTYIAKFTAYRFTNILARWQARAWGNPNRLKTLLHEGGTEGRWGGSGAGVRNAFTYKSIPLSDPFRIFQKLADYMYGVDDTGANISQFPWIASSLVIDGLRPTHWETGQPYAHHSATVAGSSPYLGQPGMCFEFHAIKGSGSAATARSSLDYAAEGWNNSVSTRATLQALGAWCWAGTSPEGEAEIASRDDIEARMRVGSDDLIFKAQQGFASINGDKPQGTKYEADLASKGFAYNKEIWLNFLKPLPGNFSLCDVGSVSIKGKATCRDGVYVLTGSGTGISGAADSLCYAYRSVAGDFCLTARVTGAEVGCSGVMARESMAAGARQAAAWATGHGCKFVYRPTADGCTTEIDSEPLVTSSPWVRIVRSGNLFTAYRSNDGIVWTAIGSTAITMATRVYLGMAGYSRCNSALSTSMFDHVTVTARTDNP